jgi:hypothetical protein
LSASLKSNRKELQAWLNTFVISKENKLVIDGDIGPKTKTLFFKITGLEIK